MYIGFVNIVITVILDFYLIATVNGNHKEIPFSRISFKLAESNLYSEGAVSSGSCGCVVVAVLLFIFFVKISNQACVTNLTAEDEISVFKLNGNIG